MHRQQPGVCISLALLPTQRCAHLLLQKTFAAGQPATIEAAGQSHTLQPSMVSIKRETKKVGEARQGDLAHGHNCCPSCLGTPG